MTDFDELLIDAVRRRDFLYDKAMKGFRLPKLKTAGWREIANEVGGTEQECMRSWASLRDRFGKELRRLEAPSGSGAPKIEPWPLIDSMMFLREHVKPRRHIFWFKKVF
ncbi:PREDICTED: transcription factor Adf-1-like [Rhagoletis zephyria]|uniref:transcription factor Adf-1-like n=1 Tax=Rhagoletis zephyria TaxID=28612 RepID=UPI0008118633|nr:PREDICTED: transcription factor Adf-1-like [Rhagoletis zephyria]XP_036343618.1 transcription factor Adf-1-like [Rhagoletis pomonella]XP_036343687.1 transcription factor Adf-1-like [Rhagoletis pomonella]